MDSSSLSASFTTVAHDPKRSVRCQAVHAMVFYGTPTVNPGTASGVDGDDLSFAGKGIGIIAPSIGFWASKGGSAKWSELALGSCWPEPLAHAGVLLPARRGPVFNCQRAEYKPPGPNAGGSVSFTVAAFTWFGSGILV